MQAAAPTSSAQRVQAHADAQALVHAEDASRVTVKYQPPPDGHGSPTSLALTPLQTSEAMLQSVHETAGASPKELAVPLPNEAEAASPREAEAAAPAKENEAVASPKEVETVAPAKETEAVASPKEVETVASGKDTEVVVSPEEPETMPDTLLAALETPPAPEVVAPASLGAESSGAASTPQPSEVGVPSEPAAPLSPVVAAEVALENQATLPAAIPLPGEPASPATALATQVGQMHLASPGSPTMEATNKGLPASPSRGQRQPEPKPNPKPHVFHSVPVLPDPNRPELPPGLLGQLVVPAKAPIPAPQMVAGGGVAPSPAAPAAAPMPSGPAAPDLEGIMKNLGAAPQPGGCVLPPGLGEAIMQSLQSSPAAAVAKASSAAPASGGLDPNINSSTHRKEAMRLNRLMDSADAAVRFPHMHKLYTGTREEPWAMVRYLSYICYIHIHIYIYIPASTR